MSWLDDLIGKKIRQAGTNVADRRSLNFASGFILTDNGVTEATDVDLSGNDLPITAIASATISAVGPCYITGVGVLPGGRVVPTVAPADATTAAKTKNLCWALAAAANGASVSIMFMGLTGAIVNTSAGAVGDPVYLSDAGALSLTPGTIPARLGLVLTVSATGRVWITTSGWGSGASGVQATVVAGTMNVSAYSALSVPNGTTLTNFVSGTLGQRIVLKSVGTSTVTYDVTKIITTSGINDPLVAGDVREYCMFAAGVWTEV